MGIPFSHGGGLSERPISLLALPGPQPCPQRSAAADPIPASSTAPGPAIEIKVNSGAQCTTSGAESAVQAVDDGKASVNRRPLRRGSTCG